MQLFRKHSMAPLSPQVIKSKGGKPPKGGNPIAGAYVEIPGDNISVKTDKAGFFKFGSLLPEPDKKDIVIYYKQYSFKQTVSISESPVEIFFKP